MSADGQAIPISKAVLQDERHPPPHTGEAPVVEHLSVFAASDLAGADAPFRRWLVGGWIPDNTVTLLAGDGGTGKSLIALQLAVSVAVGRHWLDMEVDQGEALFVTAEDDTEEIHRRLEDVCRQYSCDIEGLKSLSISSLAGRDAVIAAPVGPGKLEATPLFAGLRNAVSTLRPRLVVLDTLADLFAGEENNRAQVRQFVSLLRGLAIEFRTAVVLLAHPSLQGIKSGHGFSGSTAWNNSVRQRLYLERPGDRDGDESADVNRRTLRSMKSNYAAAGTEIDLCWQGGAFVVDHGGKSNAALITEARAEQLFLDLVVQYDAQGRSVGASPAANYAPALFAKDPSAHDAKIGKRALEEAMNRLFAQDRISIEVIGPQSRQTKRITVK